MENYGGVSELCYIHIKIFKKVANTHRQNFNKFPTPPPIPYYIKEKRKKENEKDYCMEKRTH